MTVPYDTERQLLETTIKTFNKKNVFLLVYRVSETLLQTPKKKLWLSYKPPLFYIKIKYRVDTSYPQQELLKKTGFLENPTFQPENYHLTWDDTTFQFKCC